MLDSSILPLHLTHLPSHAGLPRRLRPGRDGPFGPPPGQSPAGRFPARGSHLRSTGQRSVERARGVRCAVQEADSGLRIASSAPPSIGHAGFAAVAGDATSALPDSGTTSTPASSWGHHSSCSAHESRSRATDTAQAVARAFVDASPRAGPTASLRASSGKYDVAIETCHRETDPRCA